MSNINTKIQTLAEVGLHAHQAHTAWECDKRGEAIPDSGDWEGVAEKAALARATSQELMQLLVEEAGLEDSGILQILDYWAIGVPEDATAAKAVITAEEGGVQFDDIGDLFPEAPRWQIWLYLSRYQRANALISRVRFTLEEVDAWWSEGAPFDFEDWKAKRSIPEELERKLRLNVHYLLYGWGIVSPAWANQLTRDRIWSQLPTDEWRPEDAGLPLDEFGVPTVSPKRGRRLYEAKIHKDLQENYAGDPRVAPEWTLTPIPDGVTQLRTPLEMATEGYAQHNCCAAWVDHVMSGDYAFFSVQVDDERATLLLAKGGRLCELRGLCNAKPGPKAYERVRPMVKSYMPSHRDYEPEFEPIHEAPAPPTQADEW
jgi:hypothetical protein